MNAVRVRGALHGVGATAVVSASATALGSVTGILLARGLGPAARGEFVAASVGPQVVASLLILGIDDALIYFLARARDDDEAGRAYGSALVLAGVVGSLATGLALLLQWTVFGPAARGVSTSTLVVFATLPLVNISTQVMLGAMRARQQFAVWNACRLTIPVLYLLLLTALTLAHRLGVSSAVLALYVANVALLAYLVARLVAERRLTFAPRLAVNLLRLGVQNHLIDVGQLVNQRVDQAILTRLVSPTQLGYYAIAATYAGLPLVVALAPSLHLYSETSKSGSISPGRFRSLQRRTTIYMSVAALAAALIAPVFLTVMFGAAFSPAAIPAMVLAFGAPLLALSALRTAVWRGSGRPIPAALAQGAGIVVTIAGLGLFAPRFGITAAAVTSLFAYATVTVVLFRLRPAPVVSTGMKLVEETSDAAKTMSDPARPA